MFSDGIARVLFVYCFAALWYLTETQNRDGDKVRREDKPPCGCAQRHGKKV